MAITNIRNPRYSSASGKTIDVTLDLNGETVEYTSAEHDPHGSQIYTRAKAGEFGPIAPFALPTGFEQINLVDKLKMLDRMSEAERVALDASLTAEERLRWALEPKLEEGTPLYQKIAAALGGRANAVLRADKSMVRPRGVATIQGTGNGRP